MFCINCHIVSFPMKASCCYFLNKQSLNYCFVKTLFFSHIDIREKICVCVMRILKIYSLRKFHIYKTMSLTVDTTLHVVMV